MCQSDGGELVKCGCECLQIFDGIRSIFTRPVLKKSTRYSMMAPRNAALCDAYLYRDIGKHTYIEMHKALEI